MDKKIINLYLYILIYILIICAIGSFIFSIYNSMKHVDQEISIVSDEFKLNLYFLKTVQQRNVRIKNYGLIDDEDFSSYYITFLKEDGSTNTFIKLNDIIYFNNIKLCENVHEFKVIIDKSEKEKVSIEVKICDKVYNLQYVLNQ